MKYNCSNLLSEYNKNTQRIIFHENDAWIIMIICPAISSNYLVTATLVTLKFFSPVLLRRQQTAHKPSRNRRVLAKHYPVTCACRVMSFPCGVWKLSFGNYRLAILHILLTYKFYYEIHRVFICSFPGTSYGNNNRRRGCILGLVHLKYNTRETPGSGIHFQANVGSNQKSWSTSWSSHSTVSILWPLHSVNRREDFTASYKLLSIHKLGRWALHMPHLLCTNSSPPPAPRMCVQSRNLLYSLGYPLTPFSLVYPLILLSLGACPLTVFSLVVYPNTLVTYLCTPVMPPNHFACWY